MTDNDIICEHKSNILEIQNNQHWILRWLAYLTDRVHT